MERVASDIRSNPSRAYDKGNDPSQHQPGVQLDLDPLTTADVTGTDVEPP